MIKISIIYEYIYIYIYIKEREREREREREENWKDTIMEEIEKMQDKEVILKREFDKCLFPKQKQKQKQKKTLFLCIMEKQSSAGRNQLHTSMM